MPFADTLNRACRASHPPILTIVPLPHEARTHRAKIRMTFMSQKYTIYKYNDQKESRIFDLDPITTLKDVRTALGSYITEDFRFIDFQNKKLTYNDMILSENFEDVATVSRVVGLQNQLYITDVTKKIKTDLVGFNTDRFFNRHVSCSISLNNEPAAAAANQGKMRPLMLTNVKLANPDVVGWGAMDKVVVCEKESLIQFDVSSWGAAGFGFDISPEAGPSINNAGLFISFSSCTANNYANCNLRRYYSPYDPAVDKKMISVIPTASLNIGKDRVLSYMKITAKTWIITRYTRKDGTVVPCDQPIPTLLPVRLATRLPALAAEDSTPGTPFAQLTSAETVVPGPTIQPGTTAPSPNQSSQVFGEEIHDLVMDKSPNGIIGEITFYVFVFNSHADAVAVFSAINDIDPGVWQR
jgi:hypothetical protein